MLLQLEAIVALAPLSASVAVDNLTNLIPRVKTGRNVSRLAHSSDGTVLVETLDGVPRTCPGSMVVLDNMERDVFETIKKNELAEMGFVLNASQNGRAETGND